MEEKYTPVLTLDPVAETEEVKAVKLTDEEIEKSLAETANLTPEEQQMVEAFAEKIDITDANLVMNYGAQSQAKLSEFSDSALANVKTKELGETGEMITDLIGELQIGRAHV